MRNILKYISTSSPIFNSIQKNEEDASTDIYLLIPVTRETFLRYFGYVT